MYSCEVLATKSYKTLQVLNTRSFGVLGVLGGAVGSGTALQTGRSRVRFSMESLEIFSDLIGVDSASNRNEYQESFLGVKTAGA
jgi:hypothetical protein